MTRADTGLLLFVEDPSRTATRWTTPELDGESGVKILAALHEDLLATLPGSEGTTVYLAPATGEDAEYTQELADSSALALLEVPGSVPLQRWDSGLSILFNRYAHRKIMCVDASVPDISLEEISRARRKLDLYRMILGREGEDRCWLVGFNGYEEVLGRADVGPDDLLHPLLQAAGDVGLDVSLLDTKLSMRSGAQLEVLRALARHPSYPHLASVVNRLGLAGDSRARV